MSSTGSSRPGSTLRATTRCGRTSRAGRARRSSTASERMAEVAGKARQWTPSTPNIAGRRRGYELACYGLQSRRQSDGDERARPRRGRCGPRTRHARRLRPAVRRADRERRATRSTIARTRSAWRRKRATSGSRNRLRSICRREADHRAEFARVESNPASALANGDFRWRQQGGRDLALYALERAARTDAASVRAAWVKQRVWLPLADRLYGNARIAFHAARQLNPQASDWYREADGAVPLSETQRGWRVRAGLRAGAWPDVLARSTACRRLTSRTAWRYWKARALAVAGRIPTKRPPSTPRSPPNSTSTGCLRPRRWASVSSRRARRRARCRGAVGVRRARRRARAVKLVELDMRSESRREWLYSVRGRADEASACSRPTMRAGGPLRPCDQHRRPNVGAARFRLRYLMPFREHFTPRPASRTSTRRCCSASRGRNRGSRRTSCPSAGAVGLMQLMPPTARWVAKQLNRADYRPSEIATSG